MSNNVDISGLSGMQLKSLVKQISDLGENGDTELAHINKEEASLLKSLGGSGTLNEKTGIPAYFNLKNMFDSFYQKQLKGKKYFSDTFGKDKYNRLSALNIQQPSNYKDLMASINRTGKYSSIKDIDNSKLFEFMKFKQSGESDRTYKTGSDWRDITGTGIASSFKPSVNVAETLSTDAKNIFNKRNLSASQANQEIKKLQDYSTPDVSIGQSSDDIFKKGAAAQAKIDVATSRSQEDAEKQARLAAVSQFTNLFG